MSAFLGATTDDVRDLASRFAMKGRRLEELREIAEASVRAVTWNGPDADDFRDRAASVLTDLAASASDVTARARGLESEAEEQDSASAAEGTVIGVGTGAWQPGIGALPDFSKWLSDGNESDKGLKGADDAIRRLVDKKIDENVEKLEMLNRGPGWLRGAKKIIPVAPEAIDFANHAVKGETTEAMFSLVRAQVSLTPFGLAEDASAAVFPMLPDDWMFPGSDIPLNEGSFIDGWEKATLAEMEDGEDNYYERAMKEGEQRGMDLSDRIGIENESVRNTFKTFGGIIGGSDAAQRDPETGAPHYLGDNIDISPFS